MLKQLCPSSIYPKIATFGTLSLLLISSILAVLLTASSTVSADTLNYPWPTDTEAPCQFAPNGGPSCTNPNNQYDLYDWGVYVNGVFHPYRNGYEYRNCTDYTQWKESTVTVSVPGNWGNGGQWYDNAPTSKQSTTPKAWDAAVVPGNPGHVAFVESVNTDGTITVSEYNHDVQGHGDKRTAVASSMGFTKFVDFGIHPSNSSNSSPKLSSNSNIQTSDGYVHVFSGNSTGSVWETWWGNGQGPTSDLLGTPTGSPITSVTSLQTSDGLVHVFAGLKSGDVYEFYFGNGHGPQFDKLSTPNGSPVTGIASKLLSDGNIHVFSSTQNGYVWDTYFGSSSLTTRQLANLSSSAINALTYTQTSDGYSHVFSGNATGTVWETYFMNLGTPVSDSLGTPTGSAIQGVSSLQSTDGMMHVFAGMKSGDVYEFYYGNGQGPQFDRLVTLNGGGAYVTSESSIQTPDGFLHAFSGITSGSNWETWWGNGSGPTSSNLGTPDGASVTSSSSLRTPDGYLHVFSTTSDGFVWETWWGNGHAPTTAMVANISG